MRMFLLNSTYLRNLQRVLNALHIVSRYLWSLKNLVWFAEYFWHRGGKGGTSSTEDNPKSDLIAAEKMKVA